MFDHAIDAAVEGIADGAPVDWEALNRAATSAADRGWLGSLRILGGIADLHHRIEEGQGELKDSIGPGAGATTATTVRASEASTTDKTTYWGRYRLVQKVGEGGFGSVHRAWDPELEREVAIKILHKRVGDARLREGVLGEGRALATIRHPNVVSVFGLEAHGDQVALCMEFVHGETLEDVLRRHGTLNAREASLVGEDVCRALAAVHLAGFVHRDVKARNVMRETAGRIVLMDFGAGRQTEELKSGLFGTVGTPLYMAPEVLAGEPASVASDVYGVGVLLYHLVTGEYPVEGKTIDDVRAAHIQGRRRLLAERRPDLPASFIHVVDGALAADPSRRYHTAAAFLEALTAVQGERSKKQVVLVAALVVVSAVLLIGFFGFLTTAAFNLTVGRTAPFDRESPAVWFRMGLRSMLTPVIYVSLMVLVALSARFALRVLALLPQVAAGLRRMRALGARLEARLGLSDPAVFAQAVAACGVVAIGAIIWRFSPLLIACASFTISDVPAEQLLPLRWDEQRGYDASLYRAVLDALILLLGVAVVRLRRLGASRVGDPRPPVAPILLLIAFAAVLLEAPYRLGWGAEGERIDVAGERCYILGENQGQALVYCPQKAIPRNEVVTLDDARVRRLGVVENIFSPPDSHR